MALVYKSNAEPITDLSNVRNKDVRILGVSDDTGSSDVTKQVSLNAIITEFNGIKDQIGSGSSSESTILSRLGIIESNITALQTKDDELDSSVSDLERDISGLRTDLNTLSSKLDALLIYLGISNVNSTDHNIEVNQIYLRSEDDDVQITGSGIMMTSNSGEDSEVTNRITPIGLTLTGTHGESSININNITVAEHTESEFDNISSLTAQGLSVRTDDTNYTEVQATSIMMTTDDLTGAAIKLDSNAGTISAENGFYQEYTQLEE